MNHSVYILTDESGVRYVGLTKRSLEVRLTAHMRRSSPDHRGAWIKSMKSRGARPGIQPLRTGLSFAEACDIERFHIRHFRAIGCDLVNTTEGGGGTEGFRHTDEAKTRISLASRSRPGVPQTAESKARLSAQRKGIKLSPERVAKAAAGHRGLKHPPRSAETLARMSAAQTGKRHAPRSAETRQKISMGKRGQKLSAEAIAKRTATHAERYCYKPRGPRSEEVKRKISETKRRRRTEALP